MEFKGTKGEWLIKGEATYDSRANMWFCALVDSEGKILQRVYGLNKEKAEANAKLIAAAPELLETLIDVKQILEAPGLIDAGDLRRIVNSAINKALGQ